MKCIVPLELETQRLKLRQFKDADWRDLHEYYSDQKATQYTVARVFTEGDTWRAMCSMIGHWHIRGYGPYALENKQTGRVMGIVGLWYPNDWPSPEIKWALAPQYWRQGYAGEAVHAVQLIAAKHIPDTSLISLIHTDNLASQKLAISVGAILENKIKFRDAIFHIYRHPLVKE